MYHGALRVFLFLLALLALLTGPQSNEVLTVQGGVTALSERTRTHLQRTVECAEQNERPKHCKLNPFIRNWSPYGCWTTWTPFDEDQDGEPLYISCLSDNVGEFAAEHVWRKFDGRSRGSPNGGGENCSPLPLADNQPDQVVCAIVRTTEEGSDVETITWVKCETLIHCGYYRSGNVCGDCCTFLFEEPATQCVHGSDLDDGALSYLLESECFLLPAVY